MNHAEAFDEDPIKGQVDDRLWIPPPRSLKTGKRVSIGPYKPVQTRYLNWRWWLAELPMRWLAKYVAYAETTKEMQGEEYIGHHVEDPTRPDVMP